MYENGWLCADTFFDRETGGVVSDEDEVETYFFVLFAFWSSELEELDDELEFCRLFFVGTPLYKVQIECLDSDQSFQKPCLNCWL